MTETPTCNSQAPPVRFPPIEAARETTTSTLTAPGVSCLIVPRELLGALMLISAIDLPSF